VERKPHLDRQGSGRELHRQPLRPLDPRGEDPSRMIVSLVRFTPARAPTGIHAVGQTLHVTDGIGLVITRDRTAARRGSWCPSGPLV
jgi:hypothetical protein